MGVGEEDRKNLNQLCCQEESLWNQGLAATVKKKKKKNIKNFKADFWTLSILWPVRARASVYNTT